LGEETIGRWRGLRGIRVGVDGNMLMMAVAQQNLGLLQGSRALMAKTIARAAGLDGLK
jgi:hypothetical protein